jgi:16S rRNA U516 pseudouridylate synthase RsuA-like enzyme
MNKINFKTKAIKTDRKYYTTGNGRFTKDKIYEFKNGCTMWDNSEKSDSYKNFEEFINSNDNFQELYKNASEESNKLMEIKRCDKTNKALEEIDVIYNGKKRNINKLTEESNNIKNEFKDLETSKLLYKDYLKLKDRQYYLNKRLPIEINELRGLKIARKILLKNIYI